MTTEQKVIGIGVLLTLVIIVGGIWLSNKNAVNNQERLSKSLMGEKIPSLGAAHVARGRSHPAYNSNPPTSGWHWGDGVAGAGIKNKIIPDELILHSMEHGAAVLWYKENLPQNEIDQLKKIFSEASGKKIMLPRKNLDVPVALTSWGYILKLKTIDAKKIIEFIDTNNDRAPEKAPI